MENKICTGEASTLPSPLNAGSYQDFTTRREMVRLHFSTQRSQNNRREHPHSSRLIPAMPRWQRSGGYNCWKKNTASPSPYTHRVPRIPRPTVDAASITMNFWGRPGLFPATGHEGSTWRRLHAPSARLIGPARIGTATRQHLHPVSIGISEWGENPVHPDEATALKRLKRPPKSHHR